MALSTYFLSLSFLKIAHQVQFELLTWAWVWGHPLEHEQPASRSSVSSWLWQPCHVSRWACHSSPPRLLAPIVFPLSSADVLWALTWGRGVDIDMPFRAQSLLLRILTIYAPLYLLLLTAHLISFSDKGWEQPIDQWSLQRLPSLHVSWTCSCVSQVLKCVPANCYSLTIFSESKVLLLLHESSCIKNKCPMSYKAINIPMS